MSGWGCPHEDKGRCLRRGESCEPGESGCVLEGRQLTAEPGPRASGKRRARALLEVKSPGGAKP
jgi:hypothetical protein